MQHAVVRGWLLGLLLLGACWCGDALATILHQDRRINWDPGVRGGIVRRTTIYATVGTNQSASQIQALIDACPSNQVVQFTNGTYWLTNALYVPSGVTLRGYGISNTILQSVGGWAGVSNRVIMLGRQGYDFDWNDTTPVDLVNTLKGSVNVTSTAPSSIALGDALIIDTLTNAAGTPPVSQYGSLGTMTWGGRPVGVGNRVMGQQAIVTNVISSTVFQIDPPLYWWYSNSPQAFVLTSSGISQWASLEDLTIDNITSGAARDTVAMQGARNCWIERVQLLGSRRYMVWGYGAFWCTIKRCRFVGGTPLGADNSSQYTSSRAYGLFAGPHFDANLVTDNHFESLTMMVSWEGCSAGNVFSYNFGTNIWWNQLADYPRRFGILMHGSHPFMNLMEGNWTGGRLRADEYWGTSSHFTVLRNRIVQVDRGSPPSQMWTIDIERNNESWNFIGNLLGGGGGVIEDNYEYINGESAPYDDTRSTIWKIAYRALGNDATLYSTATLNSILRWGNWCYRTNDTIAGSGLTWHPDNVVDTFDTQIPQSYYLAGKPEDWGDLDWPPYDPYNPSLNTPERLPVGYYNRYGVWPPVRQPGQAAVGNAAPAGNKTRNIGPQFRGY